MNYEREIYMLRGFVFGWLVACSCSLCVFGDDGPITIEGVGRSVDPNNDCKFDLTDNGFRISVPGSYHDFVAERKQWNAPLVLSRIDTDFVMQVKVDRHLKPSEKSSVATIPPYVGAGIVVIDNKSNHLSLQVGFVKFKDRNLRYANFELRERGNLQAAQNRLQLIEDRDVYLRLERKGKKFYALVSYDRITWESYLPFETNLGQDIDGGVLVVTTSTEEAVADFTEFSIMKATEVDLELRNQP